MGFKFLPSFALSDGLLYAQSKDIMNETRAYLESDIWHAKQEGYKLPNRTNITLENWDTPNMGGDFKALLIQSISFSLIVVIIETACILLIFKKLFAICKT